MRWWWWWVVRRVLVVVRRLLVARARGPEVKAARGNLQRGKAAPCGRFWGGQEAGHVEQRDEKNACGMFVRRGKYRLLFESSIIYYNIYSRPKMRSPKIPR